MPKLRIGKRAVGPGGKVFIIAEAGINHDGDIKRAHELIDAAAECGADSIKFQTHLAEAEMLNVSDTAVYLNESLFQLIRRMELTLDQHLELKEHAQKRGIIFLSTPFSREAADLLAKVGVAAYKIGSGELTNLPLLGHVAALRKPMIVSTGMSDFREVAATVAFLRSRKAAFGLMQCTSMYPAPPEHAHLKVVPRYMKAFKVPVGLSDHTQGNYTAFAAVTLGASMVEKHFTISRQWPGPDQQSSIEPAELADLVKGIRAIESALDDKKAPSDVERGLQKLFRESVVTLRAVPRGTKLTREMVWVKRPGSGIPASQLAKVVGKKAKRDLAANQLVQWEDLG